MSATPTLAPMRFGHFELQPQQRRLLAGGTPAPLGARALDILILLASRSGELVSKRELMDEVWPGLVVEENNLAVHISALRKVLGNAAIATIPGWGYRFTAATTSTASTAPTVDANQPPVAPPQVSGVATPAPATTAPSRTLLPRSNLPAELPPLLGRSVDLQALGALVDSAALVTVVGAGGIGKTVLARQLLQACRQRWPQGVCWVELAPVNDAAMLPGALMAALGIDSAGGDPLAALLQAVAPLQMLIALDNAEHLLADIAQLCKALTDAAPGLHLLVTSQAPLKLAIERVYRLDTLAVPTAPMPAARALDFSAVALFVERARAADARFTLEDAQVGAVIDLCTALDGLPLALELAAARAPMLGLQRLAASMNERLKLLTRSRDRAAPARQQTLRAALEWSHGFLDPREQAVFRRLGVIAGSASLDLVQQVVSDPGADGERGSGHEGGAYEGTLDAWAALDALGVLVDRSLVAVMAASGVGERHAEPRYRLLESQRAFALERLEAAGELATLQQRHAAAVAHHFEAAWVERDSGTVRFAEWQHRLAPDLDNAREAIAWARSAGDANAMLAIGATLLRAMPRALQAERLTLADDFEQQITPAIAPRQRLRTWLMLAAVWADSQLQRSAAATQQAIQLAAELDGQERPRHQRYPALYECCYWAAKAGDSAAAEQALAELRSPQDLAWTPQRRFYIAEAEGVVTELHGDRPELLRQYRRALPLPAAAAAARGQPGWAVSAGTAPGTDSANHGNDGADIAEVANADPRPRAQARLNLFAARLVLNDLAQAGPLAVQGWAEAAALGLQPAWLAALAGWSLLDGRAADAARLLGRLDAGPAAESSSPTLALTRERVASALGKAELKRLAAEGASLDDAAVAAMLRAALASSPASTSERR